MSDRAAVLARSLRRELLAQAPHGLALAAHAEERSVVPGALLEQLAAGEDFSAQVLPASPVVTGTASGQPLRNIQTREAARLPPDR